MRIDLPQCNFKNCRYSFDGNCTNRDKYNYCDYRFAKINAIKEFAENIKAKINVDLACGADSAVYLEDTLPKDIDNIVKEMEGKSDG